MAKKKPHPPKPAGDDASKEPGMKMPPWAKKNDAKKKPKKK